MEGLIKVLKSFDLLKDVDVKALFIKWGSDNIEKNLIPIIRKHRVEIVYEHVRQKHFSDAISRYEAFYFTENPDEWVTPLKIQEDYTLYQFDSSELEAEHYYAHWTELSRMSDDYDTIYEQAINYWKGIKPADDNRIEILALGKFSVVNKNVIPVEQGTKMS